MDMIHVVLLALLLTVLLLFIILVVTKKKLKKCKFLYRQASDTIQQYKSEEDDREKGKAYYQEQEASIDEFHNPCHPENYYVKKNSLMSDSEQYWYYLVCKLIENTTYYAFPQVRVADFIALNKDSEKLKNGGAINFKKFLKIRSSITSKSVDILICKKEKTLNKKFNYWNYIPFLIIEVDGKIHFAGNEKVEENDKFKNELFEGLGLKMIRIMSDFDPDKILSIEVRREQKKLYVENIKKEIKDALGITFF